MTTPQSLNISLVLALLATFTLSSACKPPITATMVSEKIAQETELIVETLFDKTLTTLEAFSRITPLATIDQNFKALETLFDESIDNPFGTDDEEQIWGNLENWREDSKELKAELKRILTTRIFHRDQVETLDEDNALFILKESIFCAPEKALRNGDNFTADEEKECIDFLVKVQPQIFVQQLKKDLFELKMLIGAQQHNPFNLILANDRLEIEFNLSEIKESLAILNVIFMDSNIEEAIENESIKKLSGKIRFALNFSAAKEARLSLSATEDTILTTQERPGVVNGDADTLLSLTAGNDLIVFELDGNQQHIRTTTQIQNMRLGVRQQTWDFDKWSSCTDSASCSAGFYCGEYWGDWGTCLCEDDDACGSNQRCNKSGRCLNLGEILTLELDHFKSAATLELNTSGKLKFDSSLLEPITLQISVDRRPPMTFFLEAGDSILSLDLNPQTLDVGLALPLLNVNVPLDEIADVLPEMLPYLSDQENPEAATTQAENNTLALQLPGLTLDAYLSENVDTLDVHNIGFGPSKTNLALNDTQILSFDLNKNDNRNFALNLTPLRDESSFHFFIEPKIDLEVTTAFTSLLEALKKETQELVYNDHVHLHFSGDLGASAKTVESIKGLQILTGHLRLESSAAAIDLNAGESQCLVAKGPDSGIHLLNNIVESPCP